MNVADFDGRKPWSTPVLITSTLRKTENNNNGANTDAFTSGVFIGSFS